MLLGNDAESFPRLHAYKWVSEVGATTSYTAFREKDPNVMGLGVVSGFTANATLSYQILPRRKSRKNQWLLFAACSPTHAKLSVWKSSVDYVVCVRRRTTRSFSCTVTMPFPVGASDHWSPMCGFYPSLAYSISIQRDALCFVCSCSLEPLCLILRSIFTRFSSLPSVLYV